jgi:hypothetical protein
MEETELVAEERKAKLRGKFRKEFSSRYFLSWIRDIVTRGGG